MNQSSSSSYKAPINHNNTKQPNLTKMWKFIRHPRRHSISKISKSDYCYHTNANDPQLTPVTKSDETKPASTPNLMSSSIPLPICDKIPSTIIVWDFSARRGNDGDGDDNGDDDDDDDDLDSMVSTLTTSTRKQTQTFEGDTPLAIVGRALLATHTTTPAVRKQKRRRRRIFRL